MIALTDIVKSIEKQLLNVLATSKYKTVKFSSTDITKDIIRPSLYLEIGDYKSGMHNSSNKEKKLEIRIYYFAKNPLKTRIENMEMQDLMEKAFYRFLIINGAHFELSEDLDFTITDGVLICTISCELIEDVTEELLEEDGENTEPLEEINLDTKITT